MSQPVAATSRNARALIQSPDRESIPGPQSYQDCALPLSYRGNDVKLYQRFPYE
ncbi:hypothetical protein CITRIK5_60186 [Citricoccus sp. K5]|nr:hypothetical protein CITRIK5_60186 [Citricoccus sp. K5]